MTGSSGSRRRYCAMVLGERLPAAPPLVGMAPADAGEAGIFLKDDPRMSRYLLLVGTLLALFLLLFGVAEVLRVPVLTNPAVTLGAAGVSTAVLGIGLLVADVVLPVPSSLVMITHGALFGTVLGAGLSLVGAVGATLAGYGLGRWGGRPLVGRICSEQERRRAETLVRRWGLLAVTASRPVPLLAETVAVVAGMSSLGPLRTSVAALLGALPGALLYG
ncbi:MAG: TVP38/TMEM64 family protein, partial [Pseudonocardiaceae bacterium]